jgi:hypothetical protein
MRNNQFANVCLLIIVCLLAVIAFRLDTASAYAAKKYRYEVIPANQGAAGQDVAAKVEKETQAGWELVAAPMWQADSLNNPQAILIFRK